MKNYCIILLLCCGLYSCTKAPTTDYEAVKDKNTGTVTATINDRSKWSGNYTSMLSNNNDGFNISSSLYTDGIIRQEIHLTNVLPAIGNSQQFHSQLTEDGHYKSYINDSTIMSFSTLDHDVTEAYYYVLANSDSYMIVDSYDADKQRITGHFQATLFTNQKPTQGYADTLKITDGHFDVNILREE